MPFLLYGKCSGGDMQFWPEQYSFLGPVLNPFFLKRDSIVEIG